MRSVAAVTIRSSFGARASLSGLGAISTVEAGVSLGTQEEGVTVPGENGRLAGGGSRKSFQAPVAEPWPITAGSTTASALLQIANSLLRQPGLFPEPLTMKSIQGSGLALLAYGGSRMSFFLALHLLTIGLNEGLAPQPQSTATGSESAGSRAQDQTHPLTQALEALPGAVELLRRDAANVAKGLYRVPYDVHPAHRQWDPSFIWETSTTSFAFFRDVMLRRLRNGWQETVFSSEEARINGSRYPDYYLQNFHFQDGWLSEFSARGYEAATETLFLGMQDAMQRAGLVPLHYFMRGRSPSETVLVDVACGTGRFLTFVKDNHPSMQTIGLDLSPQFLARARENMAYFQAFDRQVNGFRGLTPTTFLQGDAEEMPLADASVDVVSCVYLFHELPPASRQQVVEDMRRVLRPGGIVVLNDAIQEEDNPPYKLSAFPAAYHEPYYMSYVQADIPGLFSASGFVLVYQAVAHFSKVWCFQRGT